MWGVNSYYAKNVNFTTLKNGALNYRAPEGDLNRIYAGFLRRCGRSAWVFKP